jgi:Putative zinc-finger
MSCSPFDVRDYFLQELAPPQRLQVEAHAETCAACREELERLGATEAALFCLRDEEIPQRIGFISDKIFEPSPARRWLTAFWGSTARLGFASAVVLSVALSYSTWRRTSAPAAGPVTAVHTAVTAQARTLTPEQIDQRIQEAVTKAVAEVEAREAEKNRLQLAELRQTAEEARTKWILASAELDKSQVRAQNRRILGMVRPGETPGDMEDVK